MIESTNSKDARGEGYYNIFPEIACGQINVSTTYPGVIRAFHRHQFQEDNWFIISGQFEVVLATEFDVTKADWRRGPNDVWGAEVDVKYLGPGDSVNIPKLVWHGFRVLGIEPGILLYYVTNKFDPEKPDEERASWARFYSWKTEYK